MARIRFEDEMAKQGEMELAKIKRGDLVKFRADFMKRADDEDDTERKVLAGEIGEVLDVFPQVPGILVEAPCEMHSMGSRISGDASIMVTPEDVLLVVDSRDPRISSSRILEAAATPEEVDVLVRSLGLREALALNRRVVVAELQGRRLTRAARFIAGLSDGGWIDYAFGAGLVKTAAWTMTWHDWPWLVIWAMDANKARFPGQGPFSVKNRRHVLWALDENAKRLQKTVPKHKLDWSDEDETVAELAEESTRLAEFIRRSDDKGWQKALADFEDMAKESEDPTLYDELDRWMDPQVPKEPTLTEDDSGALEMDMGPEVPRPPEVPPQPLDVSLEDLATQQVNREQKDQRLTQQLDRMFPEQAGPKTAPPPQAAPESHALPIAPEPVPGEFTLEEPGQPDTPTYTSPEQPPKPKGPASPFGGPSKYDVQPFMAPEKAPHEWATPPAPEAPRVPISVYPGYEKGTKPGSVKVWAEPEMLVDNRKTRETGAVVGFQPGDKVLVDVTDPDTQLPVGDKPAVWEAVDVRLSPRWEFPVEKLTPDEMASWRKTRHNVQKQDRRDKDGEVTTVTAAELLYEARDRDQRIADHRARGLDPARRPEGPARGLPAGRQRERRDHHRQAERGAGESAVDDAPAGFARAALAPLGINELRRYMRSETPFGVVSAYKGRSKKQNQRAHGDLMAELQRRGYSPGQIRPLMGQYFGEQGEMKAEKSYLVLGMSFEDAQELGQLFGQQSVIYKSPDGVVGAYYTDGSGRVNYALKPDGDLAVGEEAAPRIEERHPKDEKRGPPSKQDPWSKARNVGFEFSIDWGKTFDYDPASGPAPAADVSRRLTPATTVTAAECA